MEINIVDLFLVGFFVALAQVFADSYLTKGVLVFQNGNKKGIFIHKTPLWMFFAWILTVDSLYLLYLFLKEAGFAKPGQQFIILGFLLFFLIELTVNNYLPFLWHRKCKFQILNVAVYAIFAELFSVYLLWNLFLIVDTLDYTNIILFSLVVGILIAIIFVSLCFFSKKIEKID